MNKSQEMRKRNTLAALILLLSFSLVSCSKEMHSSVNREKTTDNSKNNTTDRINIDNLSEINISQWRNDESSSEFYRNNIKICKDEIVLNDSVTYITNDFTQNNIEVSEVMLKPIKLTADYAAENASFTVNMDSLGIVEVSDIDDTIKKELSKYIPINTALELGQEKELKFEALGKKNISIWFYPICYKMLYNGKEYKILKISNKIDDKNIIKVVSDGVYEVRFATNP